MFNNILHISTAAIISLASLLIAKNELSTSEARYRITVVIT